MHIFTRSLVSTILLLTATSATPIPHDGSHEPSPTTSDTAAPSAHPTTYSNYIFRFPKASSNGAKVNTSEILTSLAPHGFNISHLHHTFSETMNGFAAHMSDHCVNILKEMESGVIIEPVVTYKAQAPFATPSPVFTNLDGFTLGAGVNTNPAAPKKTAPAPAPSPSQRVVLLQQDATWGLQRLSQQEPIPMKYSDPDSKVTSQTFNYTFDQSSGENVDIYIIDTGINVAHKDFNGRARIEFVAETLSSNPAEGTDDHAGHGTHCAGTTASSHFGVAKKATIHAIKIMGKTGGGLSSDIAAGIEAMLKRHNERMKDPNFRGSVASMSFGLDVPDEQLDNQSFASNSPALEKAIMVANAAGIHTVIAAGNQGIDACRVSPALLSRQVEPEYNYTASVITVGATNIYDNRADFSNYGKCITTYAPGVSILSTYIGDDEATTVMQGTSMATPHVAGMVAYLLGVKPELKKDVVRMKKLIMNMATKGSLTNIKDKTDTKILAYNGIDN
ncbi:hypothetical protein H072_8354 [Dactylellina haptotyla CBS 200.50]|uniref:Peptidase S8/S53 domain-containing protein n=1 Tax=Dactylellina haptotyla (strain CBS 200.50) TaxID=1284197 RepID=S8A9N5_DACHA|nr:hypothetical protein H072_8354 [Dactylellina haptotyla CBS 200.50]